MALSHARDAELLALLAPLLLARAPGPARRWVTGAGRRADVTVTGYRRSASALSLR